MSFLIFCIDVAFIGTKYKGIRMMYARVRTEEARSVHEGHGI
jgi:hypothetical protein